MWHPKKTNIAGRVFKKTCYYATLDHQKWWSNGFFAIKEDLLTKRTIKAINNYNPKDYQQELSNLYESLKTSDYNTLFLESKHIQYGDLYINLYLKYETDGNSSYVAVQSQYMPIAYVYLWQKEDDYYIVQKNGKDINLIIMPYRFNDREIAILRNKAHNRPKNRFIALLEE